MNMTDYVVSRVLQGIPLLFGITIVIFVVLLVLPGNPARLIQGEHATPEMTAYLIEKWGLDQPLHIRYVRWLSGVIRLDFGRSLWTNRPVLPTVLSHLANSLLLGIFAITSGALLAIPIGIISAIKPNSKTDSLSRVAALIGLSIPIFWTGLLMQLFFSVRLGILPVSGMAGTILSVDRLKSLILPVVSLAIVGAAMDGRVLRSSMLEVINKEFILTARAKGLSMREVLRAHALPNAILPFFTMVGLHMRMVLGGLVVVEAVFAWPGIGLLFWQSVFNRDYPTVQACALVVATGVFLVNLLVDITYAFLDPRIRFESTEGR
jgi:peptide/nickel transport system permease protein